MPAGRIERRLAIGVIGLSAVVFIALAPFAQAPLAAVPAFIPIYESALIINDLVTALLLFGQFAQHRSRSLLALACGYLFSGLIVIPHALSFPGLFAPTGLLGAGAQTTAWLYMFWHGGFPLFVMAYAGLEWHGRRSDAGAGGAVASALAVVGLVSLLTLQATAGQAFLPAIMNANHYTPAMASVVSSVLALSAAALLVLRRKRNTSVLDLWLMVVMSAWLCDIGLSAVFNAGRFDLGFYAGRIYGWLATSFVLAVLLLETSGLYCRLAQDKADLEDQAQTLERSNQVLASTLFSLLDALSDSIVTIDETGNILTGNPAFERLFGYSSADVVGRNVRTIMPEPYRSEHDGYLSRYLREGKPRIIGQGQREVSGLHKDGHSFPVDLSVSEVNVADRRMFIGALRDNTDRKKAEDALRASEARLRVITDSLPILIFQTDRAGRLLFANKVLTAWFGEEAGADGATAAQVVGPFLAAQLVAGRDRLTDGQTFSAEGTVTDRENNTRNVRLTLVPGGGAEDDVLGVMEDVTKLNSTLAQLHRAQKMEAVGQLTGGISHDFNNLLGIIIGNLDLLEGAFENDPDKAELANSALAAALRGAELTRALLAFSRRQTLNPTPTDVNDVLTKLALLLRRTLGEQVTVTLGTDDTLWPISIDVAQFESAVTNLAINARDAMPDGGRLVVTTRNAVLDEHYVELNPDAVAGDYVLIEVSDSGSGMTAEVARRVFEPFFTTKAEGKGTGLGLSMVYGFIKQSGGHIKIYSELGHGTTIRLYLPRLVDGSVTTADTPAASASAGGNETILVVEDNDEMRRMVIRQLRGLGYHTLEAPNGVQALELIRTGIAFDLLFSDVVMPGGMSGFDLGREARAHNHNLRVLFTSGFPGTMIPEAENGLRVELLSKPYRKDDLARRVLDALGGRKDAP